MKKLSYLLVVTLVFALGCSKKDKKYIPLSILDGDGASTNVSSNSLNGTLVKISVSPAQSSIAKGTKASYRATGIYSNDSIKDITEDCTWSVSTNVEKAELDSSKKGRFKGLDIGTAKINAKFETLSGEANLTITAATLVSIDISRIPVLPAGATAQYYATGIFSDGTTQDITSLVTWSTGSSSNITIDASGVGTGGSVGTTNVIATAPASLGGIIGSASTEVKSTSLVAVLVSGASNLGAGTSSSYQAIASFVDGTALNVTSLSTWNVSDSTHATVSDISGTKGVLSSTSAGSVNVQATYMNVTGGIDVTLSSATVSSLSITPTVTIIKGTTYQYTATATYSDGSTQNVSNSAVWASSDLSIAGVTSSVTNGGLTQGISSGNANITVSFGGKTATSSLRVSSATLVSISIGSNAGINKGETKQFTAMGTYSDGTVQDISSLVSWSSSNTASSSVGNSSMDKGKAYADGIGTSTISATFAGVTGSGTLTVTGVASTQTVADYNVSLPGQLSVTSPPSGDFSGIAYNGATNAAGFISAVPDYGQTSCSTLGTYVLGLVINDNPNIVTASNQVSSSTTNFTGGCTSVYNLAVTTGSGKKPTELSNHLIGQIGVNVANGTVTSLPSNQASETATTSFRVILQVTHNAGGSEIVGVGVSSASEYSSNEAILVGFLNGTNISSSSTTFANKSDSFTGIADPLVDFVWVVDNSGSMSGEQSAVSDNSATFFNKLSNKHLDFRLGVITTGHNGSGTSSNANYKCKTTGDPVGSNVKLAYELWGTGWTTSLDGASAFQSNVTGTGISGCGNETAVHWAQRALGVGGTATIVPRSGAKLIFVILSDEGDSYGYFNDGATFNTADNVFVTNGYKVYSVIGLHDGSRTNSGVALGMPGKCDSDSSNSSAPKATSSNSTDTTYYNLSLATGGSSGSICSSDYSSTMDNIVTQAAGNSGYVLSRTPLSSSIVVKVNGATVSQDATNGWQYNSSSKTIVFSGTAWPSTGATIQVTYDYDTSVAMSGDNDSSLMAYISNASDSGSARGAAAAVALLVGAILAGRMWSRKKRRLK